MAPGPRVGAGTAGAVALGRAVGVRAVRDHLAGQLLSGSAAVAAAAGRRVAALPAGGLVLDALTGGLPTHVTLRMVAVDDLVATALAEDPDAQVVVLGAGLDSRAWRLPAFADRDVFEVDRPALQVAKRRAVADVPTPARVHWVPADLVTDDLAAALAGAGHDRERTTVWLWEAVLPYLPPSAGASVLADMAEASPAGSALVLTWARDAFRGSALRRGVGAVVQTGFRLAGEPLQGLVSRDELDRLLAAHAWTVRRSGLLRQWADLVPGCHPATDLFRVEEVLLATRDPQE